VEALAFETISLGLLPWRLVARRIGGWSGWILIQPTTLTRGLLTARLVAATILTRRWLRWRNLGERYSAERHRQRQHQRSNQQRNALPPLLLTSFPFSSKRNRPTSL
jgi:hypothetical protein